ncbi:hypothetical protein E3E12_07325 [Formicincola oecophyllae]|uniref:Rhamnogalacturonase A/B/Epimerase-like pectate lyase domain-containing protein n=1 Tax=Formicincola oecophyllae TaxID=2558361 RepID=A0A4Y6U983_9PROT|nr:glycosyl hydrolase family 28-related protein [Formicincola oecophyllae]QDH14019.1 hypothetical protein E3E12_07325 [Formicincola oecophyllae]
MTTPSIAPQSAQDDGTPITLQQAQARSWPSIIDYGAIVGGVHDCSSAFQDAYQAGLNDPTKSVIHVPPGVYLCKQTVMCGGGVTFVGSPLVVDNGEDGTNPDPDKRGTNGTTLLFPEGVSTMVQVGNEQLGGQGGGIMGIKLMREGWGKGDFNPAAAIPAGSIGVDYVNANNPVCQDIMVAGCETGFRFISTDGGNGISCQARNLHTSAITGSHVVLSTWPELYIEGSRFGLNGATYDCPCDAFITVTGGVVGNPAAGPNTLFCSNVQFNLGNNWVDSLIAWKDMTPDYRSDVETWHFTNCHVETINNIVRTDSTLRTLDDLAFTNCSFYFQPPAGESSSGWAVDQATQVTRCQFNGCAINTSLALEMGAGSDMAFTGNMVRGSFSFTSTHTTSDGGPRLALANNVLESGLLNLSGVWNELSVAGGTCSGVNDFATAGHKSILLPPNTYLGAPVYLKTPNGADLAFQEDSNIVLYGAQRQVLASFNTQESNPVPSFPQGITTPSVNGQATQRLDVQARHGDSVTYPSAFKEAPSVHITPAAAGGGFWLAAVDTSQTHDGQGFTLAVWNMAEGRPETAQAVPFTITATGPAL